MRNIIRTALVLGTLAAPVVALADAPKKEAPAAKADAKTDAPKADAKTDAKAPKADAKKDAPKADAKKDAAKPATK